MTGMMQQMMQNMGGMQNLINTPYTQNLLESLIGNPDLAQQLLSANPLFANNPEMQEQLRNIGPTVLNQLRDPEFQQVFSNPAAMQAIMQIQQGIEQLRVAAPGFANRLISEPNIVKNLKCNYSSVISEWDLEVQLHRI
jgi:ubiquilin